MSFTVKISDAQMRSVQADIKKAATDIEKEVRRVHAETAINVRRKAIRNIEAYGSRTVRRKGEDKNVQWLVDTGTMRNSIAISFESDFSDLPKLDQSSSADKGTASKAKSDSMASVAAVSSGKIATGVGTAVHYAKYHEYGTVRIKARPFLVPAAEDERPHFERKMKKATQGK